MINQLAPLATKPDSLTYEEFCEILNSLILYADLLEMGPAERHGYYTAVIRHHAYKLARLIQTPNKQDV